MHGELIADLAVVTMVAGVTGMVARSAGLPVVLGHLLAGLIVGPYLPIPLFADVARMQELAELGVVLVMFVVGLEFRVKRLLTILPVSGLTAVVQIAALFWAGFTTGTLLGWNTQASVCLGAMLAISSTMVVSAVMRSVKVDEEVRTHAFGVLVVQDVVAIVLIALVTAISLGEPLTIDAVGLLAGRLVGALVAMLVLGLLVLPRLVRLALAQQGTELIVVLVAGAAFGMAFLAHELGYSYALGAFVAGMAVAESGRGHEIERAIDPLRAVFAAIFFVSIGMTVDPLVAWRTLPLALLISAVVIIAQLTSVATTTVLTGGSIRKGIFTGLALGQIGEFSFILATIASAGKIVPEETLPVLVTVATLTAFTTPLLLGRALSIVDVVDRLVPDRILRVLAAYHSLTRSAAASGGWQRLRPPAVSLAIDWVALVIIFIARSTVLQHVPSDLIMVVNVATLALAVPLLIGLFRSGRRLAAEVRILAEQASGTTPLARAVEGTALIALIIGVGIPTATVLRPAVQGAWIETALLAALVIALISLRLSVEHVDDAHSSGVVTLALGIADRAGTGDTEDVHAEVHQANEGPLAGLDYHLVTVQADDFASGKTLTELDLRCATGATVVAISRDGVTTPLPTGHDVVRCGDVVAVSGSGDAVARARALFER